MPLRRLHGARWVTPTNRCTLSYKGFEVKNDANLLDILERLPEARADFAHTKPADLSPAADYSLLCDAFGVHSLRATLVDLGPMRCSHAWRITEAGVMVKESTEHEPDRSFPTAMATIVQLSPVGPAHTHKRELDPLCWAFAWLVGERHVAVVEAQYRMARSDHGDADVAMVRQICDAVVRTPLASAHGAASQCAPRPVGSFVEMASSFRPALAAARLASRPASLPEALTGGSLGRSSWLGLSQRTVWVVLALGLVLAGMLIALQQSAKSLRADSAQLQTKADATMKQMVGKALAEGDYGEVQAELASFSSLNYFDSALVTNARGRVIAAIGPIQGIRMGDPLAAAAAGGARVIDLNQGAGLSGKLLVWERTGRDAPGSGNKWLTTAAVLIGLVAAAAAAGLLRSLRRRQRIGQS